MPLVETFLKVEAWESFVGMTFAATSPTTASSSIIYSHLKDEVLPGSGCNFILIYYCAHQRNISGLPRDQ